MNTTHYRFAPFAADYDVDMFDCGDTNYNRWLREGADTAVRAGTAGVYVLLQDAPAAPSRVVGYYAIAPTAVVRAELPRAAAGGGPDPVPGFLLAKVALDQSLQGSEEKWGTQLILSALRRIVDAASVSGGRVIVVDADNEGLVPFYAGHSFLPTKADPLRMYMKVATARKLIAGYDAS